MNFLGKMAPRISPEAILIGIAGCPFAKRFLASLMVKSSKASISLRLSYSIVLPAKICPSSFNVS